MYFREKEDTNIDSQFENNRESKFNLKNLKLKPILLIAGGIILLIAIILIIVSLINNKSKYTLELYGDEVITIILGNDYIEPGYKAYDKQNNDYTNEVIITNNIDTSKVGEYEILYSIDNISRVRYVNIIDQAAETLIYLKGNQHTYLEIGEKYIEPGYEVYDTIDGNITNKVQITENINTSKVGVYKVIYSVVNSRNITTTKKRYVHVVEKGNKPNN